MTLVHTALLRNIAEGSEEVAPGFGPTAQISVPETTVEGTITSFQRSVEELSSTSAMMFEARALFLPLAAGLVVGAFALFPTAERSCRAKDLQLMTGMSGRVFWVANFLFDLHMYLVLWALLGLLYSAYYTVATVTSLAMAVALLAFAVVALPVAYMVSLFARTQPGAFSSLALSFTIIGEH
ncbi:uncharacterized protein LOC144118969 isoform X2 [Amblyomma americanum]